MRISDWSSDVCSSDLTAAKPTVEMARTPASLFAARALWRRVFEYTPSYQRFCLAKEELLEMRGHVVELLPNAMFRVRLENDHEILGDRKRVVEGKSVSVRLVLGGRRCINKKRKNI